MSAYGTYVMIQPNSSLVIMIHIEIVFVLFGIRYFVTRKLGSTFAIDRTITRILITYTKSDYKNKFIKRELYDFTVRMIVPFFKCVNDSAGIVLSRNCKNIYFMLKNSLPRFAVSYCRTINVLRELNKR